MVSPIAIDDRGITLNVNADLIAGAIGGALKADQVVFLTDVDRIFSDWPNRESLIQKATVKELENLLHLIFLLYLIYLFRCFFEQ